MIMKPKFIPIVKPPKSHSRAPLWFAFSGNALLVYTADRPDILPILKDFRELGLAENRRQFLGFYGEQPCYSIELTEECEPPAGMELRTLRQLFLRLDNEMLLLAGRAYQIMIWDRDHQYCGRCGGATEYSAGDRSRVCPACRLTAFPRLAPAVIVAITRGSDILLARSSRFRNGMFSVLAGFVEPGESMEETVDREVFEEVGLQVRNVEYFGSQPWPFPQSLMIGYMAEYAAGEISIDDDEIIEARWFPLNDLPLIPAPISIARALIDEAVRRMKS